MTSGTSRGPENENASPGPPGSTDQDATGGVGRADRVRRGYLLVSGLDYFADMLLTVTSVLLLQSLGMGSGAVFALIAAVWIVEGVSEIPTGVLADLLGRRASVAISFVLRAIGYSALFFSGSVYVAAAGVLLSALGGTFASGALEAWAVDETGADETGAKDPRGLDRLFAQGKIAENAGLVLGTLTGAALGTLDLALPQIVAGLTCALAAVLSLRLMTGRPDPDRPRPPRGAGRPSRHGCANRSARS